MNTATNAPLTTVHTSAQAPATATAAKLCAPLGDLQYNPLSELISLAKHLKSATGATDPIELREAVEAISGQSDVADVELNGCTYRFISEDHIGQALEDELGSDLYVLGCFNAGFLASVTNLPEEMVEACQAAEAYEAIGQAIIKGGHLSRVAEAYARADGYGHHFAHYDGSEEFLSGFYGRFYMFRTN